MRFYAIDLKTKKIIWEYIDKEERWWLGLEDALPEALLLHGYQNPKLPQHKGIIALNPSNGNQLWKNSSWIYLNKVGSNVLVAIDKPDVNAVVDVKRGKILEELPSSQIPSVPKQNDQTIITGQTLEPDNIAYSKIKAFVLQKLEIPVSEKITYLEHQDHILIAFYLVEKRENDGGSEDEAIQQESHNNSLTQMLWIIDKDGNQKLLSTMGKNLKGISSDPFFVFDNMVIFLADKNELVIYGLE